MAGTKPGPGDKQNLTAFKISLLFKPYFSRRGHPLGMRTSSFFLMVRRRASAVSNHENTG
jgi:hypothetical protein